MPNTIDHRGIQQDGFSDFTAQLAAALAGTPGGQTYTADVVATTPLTLQGFSTAQTGDLLDVKQNSGGQLLFNVATVASAVNGVSIVAAATGSPGVIAAIGGDTNVGLTLKPKGTGSVVINGGGTTPGAAITATGVNSAVNGVTITNAATGNAPSIAASGTDTNINLKIQGLGTGNVILAANIATPAAGSAAGAVLLGTTAAFGIYYGSGAPTVTAAQGSLYLRSDGSSTSTRLYVNTTGSTTWTNFTSAA